MKETAAVMQLTARTVAFHKYGIMQQYGLKTYVDLVRFAMKQHVVPPQN